MTKAARLIMSPNQMAMLRVIVEERIRLSRQDAAAFNQGTFGSMLHREYMRWDGKYFKATEAGKDVLQRYHQTDITRKIVTSHLTRYFIDPQARAPQKIAHELRRSA